MAIGVSLDRSISMVSSGSKPSARIAMLEGIHDEVHRIIDGHHEAGHVRIGDRQGLARQYLTDGRRMGDVAT
jgi:hypothetical protein